MEKIAGKFYNRFKDESWEQALVRENGFETLLDAVQSAVQNETSSYSFLISDYDGNILFDSSNFEEEHLSCLGMVDQTNRYFIKADYDESLLTAISDHTKGFQTEQDAIDDMNESLGESRDRVIYTIYFLTEKLVFDRVYIGQVGNL